VIFLNPDSSAVTVYLPVGSDGAAYSPELSVVTVRVNPVPVCVSVTVAPGTMEPVEATTLPRTVPVTAWARAAEGTRARVNNNRTTRHERHANNTPSFIIVIVASLNAIDVMNYETW